MITGFIMRIRFFWRKWAFILTTKLEDLKEKGYEKLKLDEIKFFFLFLNHSYSAEQFNPLFTKQNLKLLFRSANKEWLGANRSGKLEILESRRQKIFFSIKNFLLAGALQKRVEKVVLYSCVGLSLELYNPFERARLKFFLRKKLALLNRLLDYVRVINGRTIDLSSLKQHADAYHRSSLNQDRIIHTMHLAVRKQKLSNSVKEAKKALKKGLYPILVTQGLSGSYWMRGTERTIIGLFKPFDEELHAPNNPSGSRCRGALGLRKSRSGCRVGEAAHHEVGAFLVDAFFGFGIVPRTFYASFTHHMFYLTRENRMANWRPLKTKYGSFQEYIQGFVSAGHLSREERGAIPLEEFQLLVLLDVILGNTDRHINNILCGENGLAAIDHGLCFPDRHRQLSYWYWSYFSQGDQPFYRPMIDLLNTFPYQELAYTLKAKCHISPNSLHRMRERVALFAAAINNGLVPSQLEQLFMPAYLDPLQELDLTLKEAAQEQLKLYSQDYL